jgi:hypothetical protein
MSNSGAGLKEQTNQPIEWLSQLLPKYVPRCRIVTFGYQSNYLKSAPRKDINNCAQEVLLALVHWRSEDICKDEAT